jgi:hypothetical protein
MLSALAVVLLIAPHPARAAFDDPATSARATALGGAMTSVDGDPISSFYNPAALGSLRHVSLAGDFARQFDLQGGAADQSQTNAIAVAPLSSDDGALGAVALSGIYEKLGSLSIDRSAGLGYGTYHLVETDDGSFDAGARVSLLSRMEQAGGSSGTKPDVDVGALYRFGNRYAAGLSILNANSPVIRAANERDRVPFSARLGFSETARDLLLSADLSHNGPSGVYPNSTSADFGLEKWWNTANDGSWAARGGLSLGDRSQLVSAGFGWKMLGGEWDYSVTLPMSGVTRIGEAVSLVFRFGESHPEADFENILAAQIQDRRELAIEFDAQVSSLSANAQELEGELAREKAEIDSLQRQLAMKMVSESEAQKRLKSLQQNYQQSQDNFEKIRRKAKGASDKTRKQRFDEDWASFQKLRASGAADGILIEELKRILGEYKDSGVDLSEANRELLDMLKGS